MTPLSFLAAIALALALVALGVLFILQVLDRWPDPPPSRHRQQRPRPPSRYTDSRHR